MKPLERGVLSSTQMSQIQWNQRFVHKRYGFQVMTIFISLLKAIQGHQENFNQGHENQTEQWN